MAKKILPVPITPDFESDLETLNKISGPDKNLSRSKIIRNAIRMWLAIHNAPDNEKLKVAKQYIQKSFYEVKVPT